jgi:hypothetical protein
MRRLRLLASLVCLSLLTAGCVAEPGSIGSPNPSSLPPLSSPAASDALASADDCGVSNWSVDYAPFSITSLAQAGAVFVVGRLVSIEPPVYNTEDGKKPRGFPHAYGITDSQRNGSIYTPLNVNVDEVLAGAVKPGAIKALVEGGTIGCYTVNFSVAPNVDKKSTYVFVLVSANNADGKTWKDQLEVKLAWLVDSGNIVATSEGTMSLDSLKTTLAGAASSANP